MNKTEFNLTTTVLLRKGRKSLSWLHDALKGGFSTIQLLLGFIIRPLNIFVVLIVLFVWVISQRTLLWSSIQKVDTWSIASCKLIGFEVFLHYPENIGPGDKRTIDVTVHNLDAQEVQSMIIILSSSSGSLIFPSSSSITFEKLEPFASATSSINFEVAKVPINELNLEIAYYTKGKGQIISQSDCNKPVSLHYNNLRELYVWAAALPQNVDTLIKIFGYTGTLLAAFFTITGKISPVLRSILIALGIIKPDTSQK